jgi:hypothetical protein
MSLITRFKRFSKSPRYLDPAISKPKSNVIIFLPCNVIGTCPPMICKASPSATAVLPTPGSPSKIGLFFLRLDKI